MTTDTQNIERFLALSDLYFRLTGKAAGDIDSQELRELLEYVNDQTPPMMSPGQYIC